MEAWPDPARRRPEVRSMMLLTRLMVTMVMFTCKEEKKEKDEAGGDDEMEERSGGLGCHPATRLHLLQALGDNWDQPLGGRSLYIQKQTSIVRSSFTIHP